RGEREAADRRVRVVGLRACPLPVPLGEHLRRRLPLRDERRPPARAARGLLRLMAATDAQAAPALQRLITVPHGIALAVSMVIGSGLLGLPGIALSEGGIHGAALGWVIVVASVVPLIAIFS